MFSEFYDYISKLWSWRWPTVEGEVTAVNLERIPSSRGNETVRLAVAYKFSVGEDGPYTGEAYTSSIFSSDPVADVIEGYQSLHVGDSITVRYRVDDPSVNTADLSGLL